MSKFHWSLQNSKHEQKKAGFILYPAYREIAPGTIFWGSEELGAIANCHGEITWATHTVKEMKNLAINQEQFGDRASWTKCEVENHKKEWVRHCDKMTKNDECTETKGQSDLSLKNKMESKDSHKELLKNDNMIGSFVTIKESLH